MKLAFNAFVALMAANLYFYCDGNTARNQKVCADSKQPININMYGNGCQKGQKGEKGDAGAKADKGSPCKCSQNSNKPSAHIEGANRGGVTYQANQMIKDWSVSNTYSHLSGGMKYHDGKLSVPTTGRYYIYLQVYYRYSKGRIYVKVNNKPVTMIQPRWPRKSDEGSVYAGGVFNLKAGDVITCISVYANFKIYMWSYYTYFGAYLI